MQANNAKPCPFCSCKIISLNEKKVCCECIKCDASGPTADYIDDAVKLWNQALRKEDSKTGRFSLNDTSEEFREIVGAYPKTGGSNKEAYAQYLKRIKEGYQIPVIMLAVYAYVASLKRSGCIPKHLSTFLGPGQHIETNWDEVFPNGRQEQRANAAGSAGLLGLGGSQLKTINPDDDYDAGKNRRKLVF